MPQVPTLPPIATEPLSVVLLAHNVAAHVSAVVADWAALLDGLGRDSELLVVEDGSTDGTAARLDELAARHPRLKVLRHDRHRGEGAALRTGVTTASRPLLFYTLCEPEYRPADLARFLDKRLAPLAPLPAGPSEAAAATPPPSDLEIDHVHLMSGYRAGAPVPGGLRVLGGLWRVFCRVVFSYPPPPLPGWLGWRGHAGRLLARALFGLRSQDVLCPCRLMRRDVFARIPIQSEGRFAHVEVLAKANFLGHVMGGEEVPLNVEPQQDRGDVREMWRDMREVLRHPDFGPAVLPERPPPVARAPASPVESVG